MERIVFVCIVTHTYRDSIECASSSTWRWWLVVEKLFWKYECYSLHTIRNKVMRFVNSHDIINENEKNLFISAFYQVFRIFVMNRIRDKFQRSKFFPLRMLFPFTSDIYLIQETFVSVIFACYEWFWRLVPHSPANFHRRISHWCENSTEHGCVAMERDDIEMGLNWRSRWFRTSHFCR